jgi:phosphatidylinositol N-acetylglucosaminyltransferase subunit C
VRGEHFSPRAQIKYKKGAKAIKSSLLVFLALIALSPVLRTLTAATSSDSIWALSACLFILNALLADYGSSRQRTRNQER